MAGEKQRAFGSTRGLYRRVAWASRFAAVAVLVTTCCIGAEEQPKNKRIEVDTRVVEAAAGGKLDDVRNLIDKGASVNATNAQGATALMAAAFFEHPQVVRALLRMGADVNHRSNAGHSALL